MDVNNDGKVDILDLTKVATQFGGITGAFVATTKTSLPIIFVLLAIIFVVIILGIFKIFRK